MLLPLVRIDRYSALFHTKEWFPTIRSSWRLGKWDLIKIQIFVAFVLFWSLPVHATVITAATCSSTDVQAAVNSAVSGDTVKTPGPCTVAFAGTVTVHKGITVSGGGNTTITTSYAFDVQSSATVSARITGFTFSGPGDLNNGNIRGSGIKTNATWRIDHNNFLTAVSCAIAAWSNAPGLIDHNTFAGGFGVETIHNFGTGAGDTSGWVDDVTPGGPQMLFVEDNTFTNPSGSGGVGAALQSYYGARTVVRHNLFIWEGIDQHGTPGSVGARWWEFYENTFNTPNVNQSEYITIRAGSGIVFNNHHTGINTSGFHNIVYKEEDTGTWPLAFQVGSGINGQTNQHNTCGALNSSPAYSWGNDSDMTFSPQSGIQPNRDAFDSTTQPATLLRQQMAGDTCLTTYSYIPYTYPHPLQGASSIPAPTGLAAIVH
jgi:hypothetical protein